MNNNTFDLKELEALLTGYWLTDLSNFSSYIYWNFKNINWAGFYLNTGNQLQLGPFCGRPACTEIAFDRGVCGASFTKGETLIVEDVHRFPGHIACDSASKSEMVIPLIYKEKKIGVFDLDSPIVARFLSADQEMAEAAIQLLLSKTKLPF
jgi:GAF domain-containing protein